MKGPSQYACQHLENSMQIAVTSWAFLHKTTRGKKQNLQSPILCSNLLVTTLGYLIWVTQIQFCSLHKQIQTHTYRNSLTTKVSDCIGLCHPEFVHCRGVRGQSRHRSTCVQDAQLKRGAWACLLFPPYMPKSHLNIKQPAQDHTSKLWRVFLFLKCCCGKM